MLLKVGGGPSLHEVYTLFQSFCSHRVPLGEPAKTQKFISAMDQPLEFHGRDCQRGSTAPTRLLQNQNPEESEDVEIHPP